MSGANHIRSSLYVLTGSVVLALSETTVGGRNAALAGRYLGLLEGSRASGIIALDFACCAAWAILGSLLPDVDSRTSSLGRYVYLPLGHRTWTHSIWMLMLMCWISSRLPVPGAGGLAFGYFLHMLTDSVSQMGICWTYPFRRYVYYRDGAVRTGSGGNGAKCAQGHWLKFYRGGRPDPGRLFVTTDPRTGRKWPTDVFACSVILGLSLCGAAYGAARIVSHVWFR